MAGGATVDGQEATATGQVLRHMRAHVDRTQLVDGVFGVIAAVGAILTPNDPENRLKRSTLRSTSLAAVTTPDNKRRRQLREFLAVFKP